MHLVVPLVLYEPSLPAKAAQAWWNGHSLLLAATVHVEHTQPPQLQVDDCSDGNHRVELLRLSRHPHGYALHAFSHLFFGQCQSCTSAL